MGVGTGRHAPDAPAALRFLEKLSPESRYNRFLTGRRATVSPMPRGFRGVPRFDEPALRSLIVRVSQLLDLCPVIQEVDLNPVVVTTAGAVAVDARVRIGSVAAPASPADPLLKARGTRCRPS